MCYWSMYSTLLCLIGPVVQRGQNSFDAFIRLYQCRRRPMGIGRLSTVFRELGRHLLRCVTSDQTTQLRYLKGGVRYMEE